MSLSVRQPAEGFGGIAVRELATLYPTKVPESPPLFISKNAATAGMT
ncbi:hypothetical protein [Natronomonas amylolytica]